MSRSPSSDILILGATGFTGHLITRYLYAHPQRSQFKFAIAARSQAKLEELVAELSLDASIPLVVVDVTKPETVEAALKDTRARVVINTVGPFWRWGTPVVRACARHGVHYVDLTGEPAWVKDIINEFHYFALRNGATIIPSCGLDSMPSDIAVYLSNKALKEVSPDALIDTSTTAFKVRGGASGGTLATVFSSIEEVPKVKREAAKKDYVLSPVQGNPSPHTKLLYTLPYSHLKGTYYFMLPYNRPIVQRTWGLLEQESARLANQVDPGISVAEREALVRGIEGLRYGPQFKFDEFLVMPSVVHAVAYGLGFALVALVVASFSPVRWLLKKMVTQPGSGPTDEQMEKGFIVATNVSSSVATTTTPQIHVKSVLRGRGDPGYLLSAIMISESALSLLLEFDKLPPLGQRGGILTPMSGLGDVLIDRLRASGRFEFEYARIEVDGKDASASGDSKKTR